MDDEKDDLPYFATCTHCGMQTGLSLKQLEGDKPVKCPACGAPLKIVPPPKRPAIKRKKRSSDYYSIHAEREEYERQIEEEYRKPVGVAVFIIWVLGVVAMLIVMILERC